MPAGAPDQIGSSHMGCDVYPRCSSGKRCRQSWRFVPRASSDVVFLMYQGGSAQPALISPRLRHMKRNDDASTHVDRDLRKERAAIGSRRPACVWRTPPIHGRPSHKHSKDANTICSSPADRAGKACAPECDSRLQLPGVIPEPRTLFRPCSGISWSTGLRSYGDGARREGC